MSSQSPSAIGAAPLVSVSITSFNSEKWLPKALDSVLLQQTSFPIEVVIGDDCSSDRTIAVARSYQERNPQLIRVLERSKNLGMQHNYYETFEQCRGKYIAWLDADDYWTDPEKLTVQMQASESDPCVSVCSHFVRWVTKDGEVRRESYPSISPAGTALQRSFVITSCHLLQLCFVMAYIATCPNGSLTSLAWLIGRYLY